jgi:hypothetical protein
MAMPMVPMCAEDVTEDWLKRVLKNEFPEGVNMILSDLKVSIGASRTDGFMSRMYRIHVKAQPSDDDSSEVKSFHLIAKMYPPGEMHQKMVRSMRVFEREMHVYGPLLNQIAVNQKIHTEKVLPQMAKFYFAETGLDASVIVMEDLRHIGFTLNSRKIGMTKEMLKQGLKAQASLHASTFHMKQTIPVENFFVPNGNIISEPFPPTFSNFFVQVFQNLIDFARKNGREDLALKVEDYVKKVGVPFNRMMELAGPRGHMTTFCHGDCWNNNYMIRFDANDQVVEAKMVDLQIVR